MTVSSGQPRGASNALQCVDVRTLGRFKVSGTKDRVKGSRIDPWDLEISCQRGTIYPHGGALLQAFSTRSRTRRLLKALSCVRVHQDGDLATTVIFDVRRSEEHTSELQSPMYL